MPFNVMAAVTTFSDFGTPPQIKYVSVSTVSPYIFYEVMEPMPELCFTYRKFGFSEQGNVWKW